MSSSQVNTAAASQGCSLIGVQDWSPGLQANSNDFGEKGTIEEWDIPFVCKFSSAICWIYSCACIERYSKEKKQKAVEKWL